MDVNSREKAGEWLRAWQGAPPWGILCEAQRGLELGIMLSRPGPGRDQLEAALEELRAAAERIRKNHLPFRVSGV